VATRVSELARTDGRGSYADLDDRLLVLDFQAGNEDSAFDEIHRRYAGLARHICQNILRNPDDAEEATQEAMLRVFQGLHRFNGRYMVQPWVARIATNVSLDVVRSKQRRPMSDRPIDELADVIELADHDPEHVVERRLDNERVVKALAELPEHHRQALILREFEGRSHEEIGQALGVTAPQAKALIHRAKRSFRKAWSVDEAGRHGLALIAPLLMAPFRVPGALRRLLHPVGEVAGATAATPAAAAAGSSVAERATAAAVAVLLTGSAAIGAVSLRHSERSHPKPSPAVTATAAPAAATPVVTPARVKPARGEHRHETRQPRKHHAKAVPPAAQDDTTAPLENPGEQPTPDPTGEPSDQPTPPVAVVPDLQMTLGTTVSTDAACACEGDPKVTTDVEGSVDDGLSFVLAYDGAAYDAGGDDAWAAHLDVQASATGGLTAPGGGMTFILTLDNEGGRYQYSGFGELRTAEATADGSRYLYAGPYVQDGGPDDGDGAPHTGVLYIEVLVWADGTSIYTVNATLQEG
jgi:RNA polymerase sigma factor (sigma-70 family)